MKTTIKTNHTIRFFAFTFIFALIASPVLASEITVNSIIKYVNESRESRGLLPLVENENLMLVAQDKLNDMINNRYFAHTSPAGLNPWHWFEKNNYNYLYAGENLAINFITAEEEHKAWMESPTHRKNILNSDYQEIGVAVGAGEIEGKTSIIAVQEFGRTDVGVILPLDGKNFSGEDKNIIDKDLKSIPQVLSIKDEFNNPSGGGGSNLPKSDAGFWESNKAAVSEFTYNIAFLVLLISLALVPAAFLSVAYEKIILSYGEKKEKEAYNPST